MKRSFLMVTGISFGVGLLLSLSASIWSSSEQSTQVVMGIVFSWLNILFYSFIALIILHKKNIAWAMTMIVIKYLILVSVLYYVWASANTVLVLVGVFSQLMLTALVLIPLKKFVLS